MKKKEKRIILILIIISILIIGMILIFKNGKDNNDKVAEQQVDNKITGQQVDNKIVEQQVNNNVVLPSEMDNKKFLEEMEKQSENIMKEEASQNVEEYVIVTDNDNKINNSEKLRETKNFNGLKFENSTLEKNDNETLLKATVENNTGRDIEVTLVDVILLDKEGKEIITLGGIISPIKKGETTEFITSMSSDFTNAYDYKIVKK